MAKYDADQLRKLLAEGKAMRGPNGEPDYPIDDAEDLHNAIRAVGRGNAGHDTIRRYIMRRARAMNMMPAIPEDWGHVTKSELTVDLIKSDVEGKFYGIVAEPDLPDSQGDILTKQEIEQACHQFMLDYALAKAEHSPDVQHSGVAAGADLIENYIAPAGATLAGKPLTEGSWVQAWQVSDPLTKQEIDNGELDGLSLEGSGVRTPVAA